MPNTTLDGSVEKAPAVGEPRDEQTTEAMYRLLGKLHRTERRYRSMCRFSVVLMVFLAGEVVGALVYLALNS
ncbi:MAG: hypothetical protein M1541_03465 [Acidobacteria bacterium]|nr:hypothetical protein [Acidobacteriota bacterium]